MARPFIKPLPAKIQVLRGTYIPIPRIDRLITPDADEKLITLLRNSGDDVLRVASLTTRIRWILTYPFWRLRLCHFSSIRAVVNRSTRIRKTASSTFVHVFQSVSTPLPNSRNSLQYPRRIVSPSGVPKVGGGQAACPQARNTLSSSAHTLLCPEPSSAPLHITIPWR